VFDDTTAPEVSRPRQGVPKYLGGPPNFPADSLSSRPALEICSRIALYLRSHPGCYGHGLPLLPLPLRTGLLIGSTYQWPCIDRPRIDMPRLGSTSRGHISICHVFHCHVTHITIRDGTITPRIPLPCHPHPQYMMAPSRHVFHCYNSLNRARKTSCHKFTYSRVIFQITLGD
jgi:hypothetical protein